MLINRFIQNTIRSYNFVKSQLYEIKNSLLIPKKIFLFFNRGDW